MARVKRGNKRRLKRKKILRRAKGYYLAKSKLYRIAREQSDVQALKDSLDQLSIDGEVGNSAARGLPAVVRERSPQAAGTALCPVR